MGEIVPLPLRPGKPKWYPPHDWPIAPPPEWLRSPEPATGRDPADWSPGAAASPRYKARAVLLGFLLTWGPMIALAILVS
ncbi:MAG: hypothetical protein ACF8R7_18490 [Phycisphaerales bacterium JB039]